MNRRLARILFAAFLVVALVALIMVASEPSQPKHSNAPHHYGVLPASRLVASTAPELEHSEIVEGSPITVTTRGTWNEGGTPTMPTSYSYHWERCVFGETPDREQCGPIVAATGASYTPQASDVGYDIRLKLIAHQALAAGSGVSQSTIGVEPKYGDSIYPPTNFWNSRSENAAADPESTAYAKNFEEVAVTPRFTANEEGYSDRIYWVPPNAPTRKVEITTIGGSAQPKTYKESLEPYMEHVPVPPFAVAEAGLDKHIIIIQPSTNKEWDFYKWEWTGTKGKSTPKAASAGYVANYNELATGYYEVGEAGLPKGGPHEAEIWRWGSTTGGQIGLAGIVTFEDFRRKTIEHSLDFAAPSRKEHFFSPSKKTDGAVATPGTMPEGGHWRLKASSNGGTGAEDCTKNDGGTKFKIALTKMICLAAKSYGFLLTDGSVAMPLTFQDTSILGKNVYSEGPKWREGEPATEMLHEITWTGDVELEKATLWCGLRFKELGTEPAAKKEGETGCTRPAL